MSRSTSLVLNPHVLLIWIQPCKRSLTKLTLVRLYVWMHRSRSIQNSNLACLSSSDFLPNSLKQIAHCTLGFGLLAESFRFLEPGAGAGAVKHSNGGVGMILSGVSLGIEFNVNSSDGSWGLGDGLYIVGTAGDPENARTGECAYSVRGEKLFANEYRSNTLLKSAVTELDVDGIGIWFELGSVLGVFVCIIPPLSACVATRPKIGEVEVGDPYGLSWVDFSSFRKILLRQKRSAFSWNWTTLLWKLEMKCSARTLFKKYFNWKESKLWEDIEIGGVFQNHSFAVAQLEGEWTKIFVSPDFSAVFAFVDIKA